MIEGEMSFLNNPIIQSTLNQPLKAYKIMHTKRSNISRLIAQIYASYLLKNKPDLAEMQQIKPIIESQMAEHRPNLKSRQADMVIVNQVIRDLINDYDEQKTAVLFIPKKDRESLATKAKERVEKSNEQVIIFKKSDILEVIKLLSQSGVTADMIILAGLATGARFMEIVNESEFEETDEKNIIIQCSLGKKNSIIDENREDICVEKPIIGMDSDQLFDMLELIRGRVSSLSNEELLSIYNPKVNKTIKKIFPGLNQNEDSPQAMSFKLLRKIYADMAYNLHLPKFKTISKRKFMMNVLGHKTMNTGSAYSNIIVEDDEEKKEPELSEDQKNMLMNPYKNNYPEKQIELLHRASNRFEDFDLKIAKSLGFSKKMYDKYLLTLN